MKKMALRWMFLVPFVLGGGLLACSLMTGCEAESADQFFMGDVTIRPASISIGASQTTSFTAYGGDGTYTWSVSAPGLGSVVGSGISAIYSSAGTGTNYLQVTDSTGDSAAATIVQQ